ncbi:4-amino-4-deoxy-L-arabinose transferase [Granulicella pectinivorans]|uniref:4-amino-4-deoxy-L-arabinose transferase n=2 Tax=Granulicella pectinivorans TaxID=474950 RepID=A0A1I6N0F0_9BACT|nr:4-amino-4-deoxy-L-arabinose transferase [Granulicella pectinivorans]
MHSRSVRENEGSVVYARDARSSRNSMKPTATFSILARSYAGGPRPRNTAMILGGLWLLLFFAALFAPPLLDDADATHANAARAMATTGDLVTLKVNGIRYLEKAPLPYWLVALSFRIFGFNTFAVHLPQALAVALLALLGHRWANQAFGARTAFYTSIAILSTTGVFLFTRIFIPEVLLSLLLGMALFAMLKALYPEDDAPAEATQDAAGDERPADAWYAGTLFYPYAMWASLALAVLTKGLVALVFFFGTGLVFLLLMGDLRRIRRLKPVSGIVLFLAIAAPWHILAGLRNTGGMNGHGFFWFYFINEHVLRFLGKRIPMDYNKLPGYLYWMQHAVWLFPWSLFLPLSLSALRRRYVHQTTGLTHHVPSKFNTPLLNVGFLVACFGMQAILHLDWFTFLVLVLAGSAALGIPRRRAHGGLKLSPFHRIDAPQRTMLLLGIFTTIILAFFSLSTNQEYYTFPAYLPILLLTCAAITRAEQTYVHNADGRRWIAFAHASLTVMGVLIALALGYGLWVSRHLPFVPDIGDLLAHRSVGDYTLSMSHVFDLTGQSFAALRLPALLAAFAFATGPAIAWMLRMQRRHIAATTTVALTSALFLFAAHVALVRFAPMLSSEDMAASIHELEASGRIAPQNEVMLYGDQAYGSSIPFYLGRQVLLVDGRSTSMLFGASFPDAPHIFLTSADLARQWGKGERKLLFVPLEKRDEVDRLLGSRQIVLEETSGKALITDRPLDH